MGHDSPNVIKLHSLGLGGAKEINDKLEDDGVQYALRTLCYILCYIHCILIVLLLCLVRIVEDYEMTKTTKFVYIKWLGDGIPFARRGRYSVLQSSISPLFSVSYNGLDYCCTYLFTFLLNTEVAV